jgi:hypothetical protein
MAEREDKRESQKWSGTRPHEEFLELCAVSTTGELSQEEEIKLQDHLATCSECQQALKEFQAAADIGMPHLSSELYVPGTREPSSSSIGVHRNGHGRAQVNWNFAWMSFAAVVLLAVALSIYSYEVGKRQGQEAVRVAARKATEERLEVLEQQISDAGHEREILKVQLAEREKTMAGLRRQVKERSAGLNEIKIARAKLSQSLQSDEAEKLQVAQKQRRLLQKIEMTQTSLQKAQEELDAMRQESLRGQLVAESLEAQIRDLNVQLREREETIGKQEELVAHDRDIRELMGARDLYVAEVYDVAGDGAIQKPYGRLFYTKGLSLIFYAYDLDQLGGLKNPSTFQVWGGHGMDTQQARSLGIFYQDSVGKKRWVLKFDDPKTLAQIDAVFVTVEPRRGSQHPSGKPLLFANLRMEPNHQ